jgi:hypothetical protein
MTTLFETSGPILIGVVHLKALPGAPGFGGSMQQVLEFAASDAAALKAGGCDGVIVENFGDVPFYKDAVPAETIASMAVAIREVRAAFGAGPVGVNVLRNDGPAALGVCAATESQFVRVNVLTGAAVTDQGVIEGDAAGVMRARASVAPNASVFADVHVKHATPLGNETIAQAARETLGRGMADGVIVSGRSTGDPPDVALLREVREVMDGGLLLIGSGLDLSNAAELMAVADAAIVGTALKIDGDVANAVDVSRVKRLREALS